jgi:hypothetical protein
LAAFWSAWSVRIAVIFWRGDRAIAIAIIVTYRLRNCGAAAATTGTICIGIRGTRIAVTPAIGSAIAGSTGIVRIGISGTGTAVSLAPSR